ncbi:MAG: hypothetical protein COC19_00435 [SAR86 cluster bacterium]|uniref:UspA domain-containing protein n=1 Tax=SAR86 cluster bacterium TaxID=2030880 RepID=A0A2A4MUL3_9GAMM|nr:MAG: hypothetical protein COC19_00435 [SAR86 cluster bacterium]
MQNIHNILVVIDPELERDFVLDRALFIASQTQANVHLFINSTNTLNQRAFSYKAIGSQFFEKQRELVTQQYKNILRAAELEFSNLKINTNILFSEEHNLAEAIIKQARDCNCDLVLKSTHHKSKSHQRWVSNTDWRLIRKCSSPLLLVKAQQWYEGGSIVAAVDPMHIKADQSRLDHALIAGAENLAASLQQTAHVFHCYYPYVSSLFPSAEEVDEYLTEVRVQHTQKLDQLLASHNIDIDSVKLTQGELLPALTNYLSQIDANILIIGALSRNVIERAIIGNTAEKILDDCPCDVLILKT